MEVLYTEDQVQDRTREIAKEVVTTYKDKNPLFICMLKGAVPFTTDLMRAITEIDPDFHPEVEYMRTSTYGEGTEAGETKIISDLPDKVKDSLAGRTVIVVDDLIDKGNTVETVVPHLTSLGAAEVKVVVLIQKDIQSATPPPQADIHGLDAGPGWLIGNGMNNDGENAEAGRWTRDIVIVRNV